MKTFREYLTEAVGAAAEERTSTTERISRFKNLGRLMPTTFQVMLAKYRAKEGGDYRCYLIVSKDNALVAFEGPFHVDVMTMAKVERGDGFLNRIQVIDFDDPSLKTWKITRTGKNLRNRIEPRDSLLSKPTAWEAIRAITGTSATPINEARVNVVSNDLADLEEFAHFRIAMNKFQKRKGNKVILARKSMKEGGDYRCYLIVGDDDTLFMFRGPIMMSPVTLDKIEREGFLNLEIVDINDKQLRDVYELRLIGRYDLKVGSKKPRERVLPSSFREEIGLVFPAVVKPSDADTDSE